MKKIDMIGFGSWMDPADVILTEKAETTLSSTISAFIFGPF